jgi:hypothetical protein
MGHRTTERVTRSEAEKTFVRMYGEAEKERILAETKTNAPDFDETDLPYDLRPECNQYGSEELVAIWAHVETKRRCDALSKEARHLAIDMDDTTLENEIEKLHDRICHGQGHEQWLIVPDRGDD